MVTNCFLYIGYDSNPVNCKGVDEVYCFTDKLIAVNRDIYTNRHSRLELQKKLRMRPYYVTQNVFVEILKYICNMKNKIKLIGIEFADSSTIRSIRSNFEYSR